MTSIRLSGERVSCPRRAWEEEEREDERVQEERERERGIMFTTPTSSSTKARDDAEATTPVPFSLARGNLNSSIRKGKNFATPSRLKCIEDLRDELTCGICLEICVKPCSTPCGHNFCLNCLNALHKTCADQNKSCVECPKCRKTITHSLRRRKDAEVSKGDENAEVEHIFEVNSALWNVTQMLFPRMSLKSPQWKLPPPRPAPSPLSARLNDSARLMLQLTQNQGDYDDLAGEGPVLDLSNHLRMQSRLERVARRNSNTADTEADEAAESRESQPEGGDPGANGNGSAAVPRAGFTTAREMLMRSQNRLPGRQAEVMEYLT